MNLTTFRRGAILNDRFIVRDILGGGMGVVLVVWDRESNELCVLKSVRPDLVQNESAQKRFQQEVKALTMINSTFVVELQGVVSHADNLFIHMDYCEGGSLRSRIQKNGMPVQQALSYAFQICLGMDTCQFLIPGIVHRDLKPENLLLKKSGNLPFEQEDDEELIQIADFGLAQQVDIGDLNVQLQENTTRSIRLDEMHTSFGSMVGTIPYMSPEQLLGTMDLDIRSDIYSFGVILYEMIIGSRPYHISHTDIVSQAVSSINAVRLIHDLRPEIDQRISQLVAKCMAQRPEARFQDWREVLEGFHQIVRLKPRTEHAQNVINETSDKIELTSKDLYGPWLELWPEDEQAELETMKSEGMAMIKFSWDMSQPYALRRAEALYHANMERDAIQIIDDALKLPTDLQAAIQYLSSKLSVTNGKKSDIVKTERGFSVDSPFLVKQLLVLRGKCYSAILDGKQDQELAHAAVINAILISHLFPEDVVCLCLAAQAYLITEQFDLAQKLIEQAAELDPNSDFVRVNREGFWKRKGKFLLAHKRVEEAISVFDHLIELAPQDASSWFNKGAALSNCGQLRESLPYFDKSTTLGHPQGAQVAAQVRQMLGIESKPQVDSVKEALTAFFQANSLTAMQQLAARFPLLLHTDFITYIEQTIVQHIPPEERPVFQQRLVWLQQVARTR